MPLASLVRPELIIPNLPGSDRPGVLRALAHLAVEQGGVAATPEELYGKLLEREELASTGIGHGVAVPHCKLRRIDRVTVGVGRHHAGVHFDALDGQPVRLFFLVISPAKSPALHLQCLASISRWVKMEDRVDELLKAEDAAAMAALFEDAV